MSEFSDLPEPALTRGADEDYYSAEQVIELLKTRVASTRAEAQAEQRDRCASAAWMHYMDVCKARGLRPSENEHWNAASAVREA